jgi:hypothetical protein
MPGGAEHQVGVEPEQAVASANLAAFDRFEQEVAAPRLNQLECRADRSLSVGDELAPDKRRLAGGQPGACLVGVFRQRAGQGRALTRPWCR